MTLYHSQHQQKHLPLRPDATEGDGHSSMMLLRKPIMTNSLPLLGTSAATPEPVTTSNTTTIEKERANSRYQIDINLATEIGQNLLAKIRTMQQTIQNQEQSISALRLEKLDIQRNLDLLAGRLRSKCEIEERLNAEIWNLEISRQEHMEQTQALNQALARSHMDQARMIRQQTLVNQELELLKAVQESWSREDSNNGKQMSKLNEVVQQRRKEAAALLSASSRTTESELYKDKIQQKRLYPTIKESIDEHRRDNDDDIDDDVNDDDASSYTSDTTASSSDSIPTRCQQTKEHVNPIIDHTTDREQQKHQQDNEDYSVCTVKKQQETQCEHQQHRPETWTFTELPPVSNLETIADEEQRKQQVDHEDDSQQCGKMIRRSLSTSVRLSRTLSAMSSSSLLHVDESQLLITNSNTQLQHRNILATGNWMWKFTRNKITRVSFSTERRHLRFVWLQPGARILYWKNHDTAELPKSARVKSFIVEIPKDEKQIPALVFRAEDREIKVQCMDMDTHSTWVQALGYTLGIESLRSNSSGRLRLFGSESAALRQRSSRLFRHVPTMPSLRSISSFYRKGNDYRDSGVASSTSWGAFDHQQQQLQKHQQHEYHPTQQEDDWKNLSSDLVSSTNGLSSAFSSSFDPNSSEQQRPQQHRRLSKRMSRRFIFGPNKQHQPFAIDVQKPQPYDSKLEC